MTKSFLLEQCKRALFVTEDELKMHDKSKNIWVDHQKGHIFIIKIIENYLYMQKEGTINKKKIKNLINSWRKEVKQKIKEYDKKYKDLDWKNEDMSPEDTELYSYFDGIDCEALTFIEIINKKRFYDSKSYEPTDWGKFK